MRLLDRQRYGNFAKAYVICFVALVGLYVVIDAFAQVDEFTEVSDGTLDLMQHMGRYYLVRLSLFYDRLSGVIAMMAAIFTVTWMQRNNEMVAMLAAGISTPRVIRPVLVSAVLVSLIAVLNQELILSRLGEEVQRPADDDGRRKVEVFGRYDVNGVQFHGKQGVRQARTIMPFHATIPVAVAGRLVEMEAAQARYFPPDAPNAPLRGGWLLHAAAMSPPVPTIDGELARVLAEVDPATLKAFPKPMPLGNDQGPSARSSASKAYFLRTEVTFETMTRSRNWYQFASTVDLFTALADPAIDTERTDIAVYLHGRLLRPLLSLTLMALSLPLVLSGEGRNMFINLGLSLGTSAAFYTFLFVMQYLGSSKVVGPELAAWVPLIGFGTLAVAGWDRIRT